MRRFLGLLVWIGFSVQGCSPSVHTGYVDLRYGGGTLGKIAVVPFENLTEHPHAGLIAAELMETEVYATAHYNILRLSEVRRRLEEKKVNVKELMKVEKVQELGRTLEVDAILVGSVSEYRYKRGLGEDPAVGINARLILVQTGDVIWASSQSNTGEGYWFTKRTLNHVAQETAHQMVQELLSAHHQVGHHH